MSDSKRMKQTKHILFALIVLSLSAPAIAMQSAIFQSPFLKEAQSTAEILPVSTEFTLEDLGKALAIFGALFVIKK